jgi:hypothetical protein
MTVRRLSDEDAKILHELEDIGIQLRKSITVLDRSDDSLVVEIDEATFPISTVLASNVFVSVD